MWSKGVRAVCILVTRVVSFTLDNVYELTDGKEGIKNMQKLSCQHHVIACMQACMVIFAGFQEREIIVHEEIKLSM